MTSSTNDEFNQANSGSQNGKKERRGINSFLVMLLVLILGGMIFYLASIINSQSYFLVVDGHNLVVEKGYFFPFGSGPFKDNERALRELYSPIPIPKGEQVAAHTKFNNLSDLDRHLFSLMGPWTKKYMQYHEGKQFEMAVFYVERARKLSGLTEGQQQELNALRGDMAYLQGRYLVTKAADELQKALKAFREAQEFGTTEKVDVAPWVVALEQRQDELRRALVQGNPEVLVNNKAVKVVPERVMLPKIAPDPAPIPVEEVVTKTPVEEVKTQLVPVEEVAEKPVADEIAKEQPVDGVASEVDLVNERRVGKPLPRSPGSL